MRTLRVFVLVRVCMHWSKAVDTILRSLQNEAFDLNSEFMLVPFDNNKKLRMTTAREHPLQGARAMKLPCNKANQRRANVAQNSRLDFASLPPSWAV